MCVCVLIKRMEKEEERVEEEKRKGECFGLRTYSFKYVKRINLKCSYQNQNQKQSHTSPHKTQKNTRKNLEVMDMFSALVVMMVSQVHKYIQTHQNVNIKNVQFSI